MNTDLTEYLECVEHWLQLVAGKEIPAPIMEYFTTVLMTGEAPDPESGCAKDAWNARELLPHNCAERACYALIKVNTNKTPYSLTRSYLYELTRLGITPPVAPLR